MCAEYQMVMDSFALQILPDINHLKCLFALTLSQRKTKNIVI